jgi:hypothetical protein
MQLNLQQLCAATVPGSELLVVNIDLLKDGCDLPYSLVIGFPPRNAHTQH